MTSTDRPDRVAVRVIRDAARLDPSGLTDWGSIPAAAGAARISATRGLLLHKGPGASTEAGVWECTPGEWECRVERDEFCHFLAGRCVYTDVSGEEIPIGPGDTAFFPAGWTGTCRVVETVRKVFMIR